MSALEKPLFTDAFKTNVTLRQTNSITIEIIENIEKDLEYYEVISLIFLLYDDNPHTALQCLTIAEKSQHYVGLLCDWAYSVQKQPNWQDKFLEALSTVQCFNILRKLGYTKTEMIERYLPFNFNTSLFIKPALKILYRLCENLSLDAILLLLSYVKEDFTNNHQELCFQTYQNEYLEMYLLHWLTVGYIEYSNFSNLTTILKKIDMYDFCDALENKTLTVKIKSRFTDNESVSSNYMNDFRLNQSQYSLETSKSSMLSKFTSYTESEYYAMNENTPGICIIINQIKFYRETDERKSIHLPTNELEVRHGTEVDEEELKKTWTQFGFQLVVFQNLNDEEIITKLKGTISDKFTPKHSCLVVCILSHGHKDIVYGSNSVPVYIQDIENVLYERTNTALRGKPKVLIIQACQGKPRQQALPINEDSENENDSAFLTTDGPSNDSKVSYVPEKADLLLCLASVPGYASVRHKIKGTWFIRSLCRWLQTDGHRRDISDILTTVTNEVSKKRWEGTCMVPMLQSTFTKKLKFILTKENNVF